LSSARARAREPLEWRLQVCGDHSLRGETCAAHIPRVIIHHATMKFGSRVSRELRARAGQDILGRVPRFDLQVRPMNPIAFGISPRRLNALDPRYRIESFDFTTCAVSFDTSRARAHNDSILIRRELVSLLARTLAEFRSVSGRSFNIAHGTAKRSRPDKGCE